MMIHRSARSGSLHIAWLTFLASLAVLALLIGGLCWISASDPVAEANAPLIVYCAAGIREPVDVAAREYEKAYGVQVQLQYGGSQTLLANIEVSRRGDLYLPADDYYIDAARAKKLVAESLQLARMTPVIGVPRGNPKKIATLDDLLTRDLRIAQTNPDAAAVGKLTRDMLQPTGQWEPLRKKTLVFKPTVNDVAADVKVGAADAGIVWDATVQQMPELEAVRVPELARRSAHVSVGVLTTTGQPTAALRFARFLAAHDRGLVQMAKAGFQPVDGDLWSERPELRLFAGAMLKPAIEKTITEFEQREGVQVTRVYNGCGILVGQMKAGSPPDAYFACDKSFMIQVKDLFLDSTDISTNQLVIVVPKGNPYGIRELKDLAKPGIRVGVGHEQQCALGALTQETLKQSGLQKSVEKNIADRSPSGDMLVNKLRAGGLDAVIAYVSNTADAPDVEAFTVKGIPCAIAVQPMAVGKESRHKQLTARLMDAIRSAESKQRFEAYGFGWEANK
jgi:molybdenum ABC transporter molybdate-binding protein